MQRILVSVLSIFVAAVPSLSAQRRGAGAPTSGNVTFAVAVADPSGAPIADVKVTLTGAAERTSRTEAGRLVFENLPAGAYKFRFEKDGFVPFEKEMSARGAAPIDVKVTLTPLTPPPAPKPVAAPTPPPAPAPPADAKPVVLDMPAFVEKNYVGHAKSKTTPLSCGTGGSSSLVQINEPLPAHVHADADEFIYVLAGEGTAIMGDQKQSLGSGVYLMIPRGLEHGFNVGPKKPLVMISTRAGERCGG